MIEWPAACIRDHQMMGRIYHTAIFSEIGAECLVGEQMLGSYIVFTVPVLTLLSEPKQLMY